MYKLYRMNTPYYFYETITRIAPFNSNEYAHASFITPKKQIIY